MSEKKIFKNLWTGDDGIPPKFNKDFMQNGPEWQKVKGLDFEQIGRILICHLSIEHYINKLIEFQTPTDFNWDDSRPSFSQKLKLLSKNKRLSRHQIIHGIETLNKIRNKFSHNLEAKIDLVYIDVIREILFKFRVSVKKNESEDEIKHFLDLYDDIALIESFTNFVCAFIAGYCHSLFSQKKKKLNLLKMNVQKFIDEWKIGMKLGRWTSEKLDYSVYKNEEMFIINVELKINLDPNIPIIISKNRFFQTSYNTLSKEHQLNPNFDENMLVNILEDLENQLNEETNHLGL